MRKIIKITLISLTIICVLIIINIIGKKIPNIKEDDIKQLLIKKAGIDLKDEIIIEKFESKGSINSDFAETYMIEFSNKEYTKIIETIKSNEKIWRKNEIGYELMIHQKTLRDTIFIFLFDTIEKKIKISIIEE